MRDLIGACYITAHSNRKTSQRLPVIMDIDLPEFEIKDKIFND
jgi:hypothetical protein